MRREHLFFNSYILPVLAAKNSANLQILHKAKVSKTSSQPTKTTHTQAFLMI